MTALVDVAHELLTADEVATIVRLHKVTVLKKCRSGEMTCVRQGRKVLVPRWAVEAYLDCCTQHATTTVPETVPAPAPTSPTPPARPRRNPNRSYKS